jgi:hypothetical protein
LGRVEDDAQVVVPEDTRGGIMNHPNLLATMVKINNLPLRSYFKELEENRSSLVCLFVLFVLV